MQRLGFIKNKEEIKILVLYCMKFLPFPVDFDAILDITTWCDNGFGFFELNEAFDEMCQSGHIEETTNDKGNKLFVVSKKGKEVAELFEDRLPFTVRKAAEASSFRVMREIKRENEIITNITNLEQNDLIVHLEIKDIFSVDMNVSNSYQASTIENNFRKNAEKIYNSILKSLTENYEEERAQ